MKAPVEPEGERRARRHARHGHRSWALALAAAAGTAALAPAPASAKSASSLPYPAPDVWAAAVRLLRVDHGFTIREKDDKAGYILFDLAESGRTFHASIELVALTEDDGRASTEAVVSVPALPSRYEMLLLAELGSKVRQERGPPPPPKPRPAPPASPKDKDKDQEGDQDHESRGTNEGKAAPQPDAGLPHIPTMPVP